MSEADLNFEDLIKLRELYECRAAALEEFQDKAKGMTTYDTEFALADIERDIEWHELNHPQASAAYHEE